MITRISLLLVGGLLWLNGLSQQGNTLRYFGQPNTVQSSAIPYGNNPHTGHYIQTGDAKIYYETYGKGHPLLLLHGGVLGSTVEMGRLIDSLSHRFQVIAVSTVVTANPNWVLRHSATSSGRKMLRR